MSFLAPALLAGLLGLAIPVLAHLFGRKKPRVVRFAALHLIEQFPPARARQRTLQDLPLLVVRLLVLLVAVLAFAQPYTTEQRVIDVVAEAHDAVLMLDISASTNLRDGDGRVSDRVEQRAREIAGALPPGSRLGFATSALKGPAARLDEASFEQFLSSLERFRGGSSEWTDATPMDQAVKSAAALFGDITADGRPRVIYVVGDLTNAGLHAVDRALGPEISVVPMPVESAAPPGGHIALEGLALLPSTGPESGESVRLLATVRRRGGQVADATTVELRLDGEVVARGELTLAPDDTGEVEFLVARPNEGPRAVELRLSDRDDPLPHDDRLFAWLRPSSSVRVRIVNGAPSGDRIADEVFFLTTALGTLEESLKISTTIISPDQLAAYEAETQSGVDPLRDTDLLVLANTPAPSDAVASLLTSYVQRGGALWISSGDRVDPAAYNRSLGPLLPHALRGAQEVGTLPGQTTRRLEALEPPNLAHPLFATDGSLLPMPSLDGVRAKRVMLLEPDPQSHASVALSYERGAPVLVTRDVGAGRVALLTTTIDRDWSNLAIDPGFVPLIDRVIRWMCASQFDRAQTAPILAGEPWRLGDIGDSRVRVMSAAGAPLVVERTPQGYVSFDTHTPGLYVVRKGEGDDTPIRRFSVRVNPIESETATSPLDSQQHDSPTAAETTEYEHRIPWWRTFAILALCLLGVEGILRILLSRRG